MGSGSGTQRGGKLFVRKKRKEKGGVAATVRGGTLGTLSLRGRKKDIK